MFTMDTAPTTSGPFISWKAQRKEFELRISKDDKSTFNGFADGGVVFDLEKVKVGWCYSAGIAGQAPEWAWWPSPSQRIDKPNDEYRWGISIPCAIGNGKMAYFEQSGAAIQNSMEKLAPALQEGVAGKSPLVRFIGSEALAFTVGRTEVPIFEVADWVASPDCFKTGGAAGIDTGTSTPTPPPASAPQTEASAGGF